MARKVDPKTTLSLASAINLLRPVNNASYGASGELEPLITLMQTVKGAEDLKRIARAIKVLTDHMVETSTVLQEAATFIQEELEKLALPEQDRNEDKKTPQKPH